MGKIYQFECECCGYRAAVAGGTAEGRDLKVLTVVCRECRSLYDCVTAIRTEASEILRNQMGSLTEELAPNVAQALSRLPVPPSGARSWQTFDPACPKDPSHHIRIWKTPGRCPRCKAYVEPSAQPYRVWD